MIQRLAWPLCKIPCKFVLCNAWDWGTSQEFQKREEMKSNFTRTVFEATWSLDREEEGKGLLAGRSIVLAQREVDEKTGEKEINSGAYSEGRISNSCMIA